MGKKVKEYKSGDFIFAKVKGYPAWPARVQKLNGKKYFVYFYGTGETANLPPNMIFDYVENKDKFLTKTVKRRDFNDGVKQIEHDFANNVPLEQVIGASAEAAPAEGANDTANDTGNDTMDDSAIDTTAADDTANDTTVGTQNATQNDTAVEDSDEAGALVIDEGKQPPQKQPRKSKAPEPAKTPKTPKTPRGRGKKEEDEDKPDEKEELVSRSGRKIRPKRYIDEQTEENATLPSPAPKKRRGASPPAAADKPEKEKEREPSKEKKEDSKEKTTKQFNNVPQLELEDLKEPFKSADAEKENILIAYLPSGQYCGIKLFQSRPASFKDDAAKLQWDKQAAANAITLKTQLERGQITAQSIITQLVMDLNLTDEEKASLDKERETEEKKSRVQFLKTEMKLIELDAKIKTCLSLEKADVESCLKLLDELMELDIKPLMLLKHPCCVETVKRMRAYVGNAPRWQLSEPDALLFASRAHTVRKQADTLYRRLKELYPVPSGLSFWEHFSALLSQFQQVTANLTADQLLEMVRPPPELSQPSAVTMQSAIDAANKEEPPLEEDEMPLKKKNVKAKKPSNSTPAKQPPKRQSSRNHKQDEKEKEADKQKETDKQKEKDKQKETDKQKEKDKQKETDDKLTEDEKDEQQEPESQEVQENNKEADETSETLKESADSTEKEVEEEPEKTNEKEPEDEPMETNDIQETTDKKDADTNEADKEQTDDKLEESDKKSPESDKKSQETDKKPQESDKKSQDTEKKSQDSEKKSQNSDKKTQDSDKKSKDSSKKTQDSEKKSKDGDKKSKESEKKSQENEKEKSSDVEKESNDHGRESRKDRKKELEDKQKEKEDEPRAKRSRGENKKTEPPPRSPAKRKSKV